MNDNLKLEWLCEECGNQYSQSLIVCEECVKSKPDNPKLVPSKDSKLIEEYEQMDPIPFGKRFFSLKGRITRLEFLFGLLAGYLIIFILTVISGLAVIPFGGYIAQFVGFIVIFIFSSKRCRDINYNPWLGITLTIFTFSLLVLLFLPGTDSANKYGPEIKKKA